MCDLLVFTKLVLGLSYFLLVAELSFSISWHRHGCHKHTAVIILWFYHIQGGVCYLGGGSFLVVLKGGVRRLRKQSILALWWSLFGDGVMQLLLGC